jgi:putative DNA primase/helicase
MTLQKHHNQNQGSLAPHVPFLNLNNSLKYEEGFRGGMHQTGIYFHGEIIADGQFHRFPTENKNNKDGWYVFFGLAGSFGDWRRDINEKWSIKSEQLSDQDQEKLREQIHKSKKAAEEEHLRKHEETAVVALDKWNNLSETVESAYLANKQVEAFGVRFGKDKDVLVIPIKDITGKLWSLQWLNPDGTKRFLSRGRKKGCFHHIGNLKDGDPIIIVEGYATGASVHMATQKSVVIAFDAGNIDPVIEDLKKTYPRSSLIIAGDDDRWKDNNIGREKAEEAAQQYGCSVVFPQFKNTDTKPTDFNDLHVLEGLEEVKKQIETVFHKTTLKALNIRDLLSLEVPPREMLLNPIIPEQGLVMIHAPRGIGKTHVSLMIAYMVATGAQMFNGKWNCTKPNKVLFVDGEMPLVVMQERLAKIVSSTDVETIREDNLFTVTPDLQPRGIADLSTPQGQQFIEEHLKDVKLLILDNYSALCRKGRENEAESWIPLQEWFLNLRRRGISVLLIHHSNKNGGQRGTSRKEDLLDTIITLRKPESYNPREGARFEVHYEKARGFYGEEAIPFEAWLKEEGGKFIWHIQDIEDRRLDQVVEFQKKGLSQRKIAQATGLSPATVNRRLKNAMEKEGFNGDDQ